MPRSPSDATRFTSTGPYVSTKPSSSTSFTSSNPATTGTQINFGSAPPGETPQQKIARLRAAAALAKQGKETTFDKTVRIGRLWADRAHRVTALSLIGLAVVSGAVATAGITDMLMHNRRKRNEWLAQKQAESARDLAIARQAEAQGTATEDQILLINRERAAMEADIAKKNQPGMFKRASNWLFSGLSKEEQKGGRLGAMATAAESAASTAVQDTRSMIQAVEHKVEAQRSTGEMAQAILKPTGGPLDRQAQLAVDSASNTAKSWTSWLTGR
ncbi:hypothetical protein HII31_09951 [Pseudocercospora fuligena]|uniref:Uncharacterized protein n=1 Tax=Pseudocercospora fuligena TaxID=685502 RepID=A0A8H6VHX0_9PEZI|nr:hypothetical protein HII31_09951 [Pseudocercospora fuligena]